MKQNTCIRKVTALILLLYCSSAGTIAQQLPGTSITGKVIDWESRQAAPFVNLALYRFSDTSFVSGTHTSTTGEFNIGSVKQGKYILKISAVAYKSQQIVLQIKEDAVLDLETIYLQESSTELEEVVVTEERIKARGEIDKTVFFVDKKVADITATGTDLLKYIPGVQVDLMQNISLHGNSNIIILVNGIEKDSKHLQRLNAAKIDRIEVMDNPPAKYQGAAGGVINIILKENLREGLEANVHLEVPSASSEVFVFPAYSLSYGAGKVNVYSSYNGDFRYFNIANSYIRSYNSTEDIKEIVSRQDVRQKSWSHRFEFGTDYFPDTKNQINFYAYFNPYSFEQDGHALLSAISTTGDDPVDWKRKKEDDNINLSSFYSLYYKHLFDTLSKHDLAVDFAFSHYKAKNTTRFTDGTSHNNITNSIRPWQNSVRLQADYNFSLTRKLKTSAGIQHKTYLMENLHSENSRYKTKIYAAYSSLHYSSKNFEAAPGIRAEKSSLGLQEQFQQKFFIVLPSLLLSYKLKHDRLIKFNYRRSVTYPEFHQLNPYVTTEDLYTFSSGNPALEPALIAQWGLEFSQPFKSSWLSTRFFLNKNSNAINKMSWLNKDGTIETKPFNLGKLTEYGIQFSGTFNVGRSVTVQPYIRGFRTCSAGNSFAEDYNIKNRQKYAYESALSSTVTVKDYFTVSARFMYNSPVNEIQWTRYSDMLYFVGIGKSFSNGFKAGVTAALPFKKTFTYQASQVNTEHFSQHLQDKIHLSLIPVIFNFNYQFSSGTKRVKINRNKENIGIAPKAGF